MILFIFLLLERGEEREKERERNINVWLPLTCPPTEVLDCNPGMCPDWELNRWPFASQARRSIHWATTARGILFISVKVCCMIVIVIKQIQKFNFLVICIHGNVYSFKQGKQCCLMMHKEHIKTVYWQCIVC